MSKTIKIGKIELDIADGSSKYIPNNCNTFIEHGEILKTLAIGIKNNLPILMIGESGTGKTSAVRYLAKETRNGLRRINLNGGTTADELVGRQLMNEKGTYWVDGALTDAMRNGDWVVLDEINAALPEVLFVLHSILDDDGYLMLTEKEDREIVRKHPNFRIFATCNPPDYSGTRELNKALLSRFAICINTEFPKPKVETEIIEHHLGNAVASSQLAAKLIGMANETRQAKEAGNADYEINTRDILNTLKLAQFVEPIEALALAFSNKLEAVENKALRAMAKLHLPVSKIKNVQRIKINNPDQIKIGGSYVIDSDLSNAYFAMTDQKQISDSWSSSDLGSILKSAAKSEAMKNDEFVVEKAFYENENLANDQEVANAGSKAASIIKFTDGPSKGKSAVLIHHRELGDSLRLLENLYELRNI